MDTRSPEGVSRHIGEAVVIAASGVDDLLASLAQEGFEVLGPTVRDGAIVVGPVHHLADLPIGIRDTQTPGSYALEQTDGDLVFAWAVGPGSWKAEFFPARQELWRAGRDAVGVTIRQASAQPRRLALFGVRPCDLAALGILDRVLRDGAYRDPLYGDRRDDCFVVVAECSHPASTCFCSSMGTGPDVNDGFDLALSELNDEVGHRFLLRIGSAAGAALVSHLETTPATAEDWTARDAHVTRATSVMGRRLDTRGLASLANDSIDSPRWRHVADRCLSCANCTLVCPTCFCSDVRDVTDITGDVIRTRGWSSCFDVDHSYLHGGPVRASGASRYRQWFTHKLSTWWDQFDTAGCVGCGRCITWCPVGIDITSEAAWLRTDHERQLEEVRS